jgi:hypothetical protein
VHRTAPGDDDPGAQKAYAGNDLGRETGRIQRDRALHQDVAEAVLADHHDQRRRRADNGLGPQSRHLALDGAFQAGQGCQPERRQQLDECRPFCAGPPNSGSASQICMPVKLVDRTKT